MRRLSLLLACAGTAALASSMVPRSLDERARMADRVVFAQVVSSRTENQGTAEKPKLVTYHHVLIGQDIRGTGPAELDVLQIGGKWGLWEQHVTEDAKFVTGETAVMLLKCLPQGACRLAGLADAKLSVNGDDVFVRDMFNNAWSKQKVAPLIAHLKQLPAMPAAQAPKAPQAQQVVK
ncbi:MAG: hypothetical protein QM723_00275 [Myxococcaceae bacterium]